MCTPGGPSPSRLRRATSPKGGGRSFSGSAPQAPPLGELSAARLTERASRPQATAPLAKGGGREAAGEFRTNGGAPEDSLRHGFAAPPPSEREACPAGDVGPPPLAQTPEKLHISIHLMEVGPHCVFFAAGWAKGLAKPGKIVYNNYCTRRCDGIGRRSGLKIRRWRQRGGPSPPTGTTKVLSR